MEKGIYHALAELYTSLALNQEKQNNIEKCNEYYQKKLENLENEYSILKKIKESSGKRDDNEAADDNIKHQLEVYLKIAENNFKLKNYEGCIKNLEEVIDRSVVDSTNVNFIFLIFFRI